VQTASRQREALANFPRQYSPYQLPSLLGYVCPRPDRMDTENHYVRVANMPRTQDPGDGLLADLHGTTIALQAMTASPAATVAPALAYEQIQYTWYGDDHRS
jgi:hypothetical protein